MVRRKYFHGIGEPELLADLLNTISFSEVSTKWLCTPGIQFRKCSQTWASHFCPLCGFPVQLQLEWCIDIGNTNIRLILLMRWLLWFLPFPYLFPSSFTFVTSSDLLVPLWHHNDVTVTSLASPHSTITSLAPLCSTFTPQWLIYLPMTS